MLVEGKKKKKKKRKTQSTVSLYGNLSTGLSTGFALTGEAALIVQLDPNRQFRKQIFRNV